MIPRTHEQRLIRELRFIRQEIHQTRHIALALFVILSKQDEIPEEIGRHMKALTKKLKGSGRKLDAAVDAAESHTSQKTAAKGAVEAKGEQENERARTEADLGRARGPGDFEPRR